MEIAPGYTVGDWKQLHLEYDNPLDWSRAIEIFGTRIRLRFIDPVDVLIAHEIGRTRGTFGFAILAIDCLLVETMQGFREGVVDHDQQSKRLIKAYLTERPAFQMFFPSATEALSFYGRYRCALLHSGQTDGDIRIQRHGRLIDRDPSGRVDINRTAFHDAVKREFEAYLLDLADSSKVTLRRNFRTKMNGICGIDDSR